MQLLLQMVYEDGTVCKFNAGGDIEKDMIRMVTEAVMKKYKRFQSPEKFREGIQKSIKAALYDFKKASIEVVGQSPELMNAEQTTNLISKR